MLAKIATKQKNKFIYFFPIFWLNNFNSRLNLDFVSKLQKASNEKFYNLLELTKKVDPHLPGWRRRRRNSNKAIKIQYKRKLKGSVRTETYFSPNLATHLHWKEMLLENIWKLNLFIEKIPPFEIGWKFHQIVLTGIAFIVGSFAYVGAS